MLIGRLTRWHAPSAALIALLATSAIGLAACYPSIARPDVAVEPSVVGLVTDVEPQRAGRFSMTVEGEETIEIVRDEALELGISTVVVGDLVLSGTSDGTPWWAGFGRSTIYPDCYAAYADTAFDEPGAVVLVYEDLRGVGVRLAKASDFRPDPDAIRSGRYDSGPEGSGGAHLCLDERGAVTGTW